MRCYLSVLDHFSPHIRGDTLAVEVRVDSPPHVLGVEPESGILRIRAHPEKGPVGQSSIHIAAPDIRVDAWEPDLSDCLSTVDVCGGPERRTEWFAPLVDRQGMVGVGDVVTKRTRRGRHAGGRR